METSVSHELVGERAYEAAVIDRLTADWHAMSENRDQEWKDSIETLKARSRDLVKNNDYIKHWVRSMKLNVIGPHGVRLQLAIKDTKTGEINRDLSKDIEARFTAWADSAQEIDVRGRMNFKEILNAALSQRMVDGEVLIMIVRASPYSKNGLSLAVLDTEQLDHKLERDFKDGRKIRASIEYDPWDRPIGFWLLSDRRSDDSITIEGRSYIRIDARDIIHLYRGDDPLMRRGIPECHTALMRLKNVTSAESDERVATRASAMKLGFFTRKTQDQPTRYSGQDLKITKKVAAETKEKSQDDSKGDRAREKKLPANPAPVEPRLRIQNLRPGSFQELPPNVEFKPFDPQHPNGNFPGFVKSQLRGASRGLGLSYETLSGDIESVNYSSIRQGALAERDAWKDEQEWVKSKLCQRIFEEWLRESINRREGLGFPVMAGDFQRVTAAAKWQARGWAWIDPLKDGEAAKLYADDLQVTSRRKIAAEMGYDFEEVLEERAAEKKLMQQYGLWDEGEKKSGAGSISGRNSAKAKPGPDADEKS